MLYKYQLSGEEIDSLELKILLITKGVNIAARFSVRIGEFK
jgi:hypothetical protein